MADFIQDRIQQRIRRRGAGSVFVPEDFLDLGGRAAVDQALSRLSRKGMIRRLARGVYDYPQRSVRVGYRSPDADAVAKKLGSKWRASVQRSGARTAYALGLSTQVPAKPIYLTDAFSRTVNAGTRTIVFKKTSPRNLVGAGTVTGDVYQALRHLGPDGVDDGAVFTLRRRLSDPDKRQLERDARHFRAWMRPVIDRVTSGSR